MVTVRAVLLTGTLWLTGALSLAAGERGITGGAPVGAAGHAPIGATAHAPVGGITPLTGPGNLPYRNGYYGAGGSVGTYGFVSTSHPGVDRGNTNHGHSYRKPEHRYGVVAPFFYGLPYDAGAYYGNDDPGYYPEGPGPVPADPMSQQFQMQQNVLTDEINHLNAKIDELQQQNQIVAQNPPPVPYAAAQPPAEPVTPPAPPVIVVLRNGQKFESNSYAVMNQTFWDFSKTPVRRVSMIDVDVPASIAATAKTGAEFPE